MCEFQVSGPIAFQAKIHQALERLAQQDYDYVRSVTCRIEPADISGAAWPDRIALGARELAQSETWLASALVHEACHLTLWRSVADERVCNAVQLEALKRMGAPQSEITHLASQDGTHVCAVIPDAGGC